MKRHLPRFTLIYFGASFLSGGKQYDTWAFYRLPATLFSTVISLPHSGGMAHINGKRSFFSSVNAVKPFRWIYI